MNQDNFAVGMVYEACPICCKKHNEQIIMPTRFTKQVVDEVKEADGKIIGFSEKPCKDCQELMEKDMVALVGIDPEKSGETFKDIHRTGSLIWLGKETIKVLIPDYEPALLLGSFVLVEEKIMTHLKQAYKAQTGIDPDNPTKQ